ncbi:MAG: uroporphyrinogen-III synthase [Gammaproteobacteria bacterium]|nr:uroporphyrinogen-III synthase [Gammaproteobacteria bacterium]NNC96786.1 uroporphyrinogen-III synthase [Gammaproteobacteria bacterium]NNM14957.1 uroporphyrinogen-III synthase [Gammaproteobacteria bacterium]
MSLEGLNVLVTRPGDRGLELCDIIQNGGAQTTYFPTASIQEERVDSKTKRTLRSVGKLHWIIFVSRNAVSFGVEQIPKKILEQANLAAIGPSTAEALEKHGLTVSLCPESSFTTEAFLEEPLMEDVGNNNVLIVTGKGGRKLLQEELEERGASCYRLEVYRRELPLKAAQDVAVKVKDNAIDVLVVTSEELLENLMRLLQKVVDKLRSIPLVVSSDRLKVRAKALGFNNSVIVADNAINVTLLSALVKWHTKTESSKDDLFTIEDDSDADDENYDDL